MISVQSFTANPYQENGYVLFDESKDCVIIDPGAYTSQEQNELSRFIESQKLTPVKLLNTHCHIDHVLGNAFVHSLYGLLPEFHKLELELLHAIPGYAPQMGIRYDLSPLPKTFLPETGNIAFGQSTLELIFAPGHSPGHLCFYSLADNFLIGGDVLFYQILNAARATGCRSPSDEIISPVFVVGGAEPLGGGPAVRPDAALFGKRYPEYLLRPSRHGLAAALARPQYRPDGQPVQEWNTLGRVADGPRHAARGRPAQPGV